MSFLKSSLRNAFSNYFPSLSLQVTADTAASGTIDNVMTHKIDALTKTREMCLGRTRFLDHFPIAVGFSSEEAVRDAAPP